MPRNLTRTRTRTRTRTLASTLTLTLTLALTLTSHLSPNQADAEGCKWSLAALWRTLAAQGVDVPTIREQVRSD